MVSARSYCRRFASVHAASRWRMRALRSGFGREVVLLVRIPIEVVQLFDPFPEREDVLPVALAEPQREVILGDVEIRAR